MKNKVKLSKEQEKYLRGYVNKGVHSSRSILRARSLLLLWEGMAQNQVAQTVGCCIATVTNLLTRYREHKGDVREVLVERPRSGQPPIITPQVEAHITALACCQAPDGSSGWTLRMIANKMVELNYVDHLSHEAVRGVLKKVNSSRGSSATGASAK